MCKWFLGAAIGLGVMGAVADPGVQLATRIKRGTLTCSWLREQKLTAQQLDSPMIVCANTRCLAEQRRRARRAKPVPARADRLKMFSAPVPRIPAPCVGTIATTPLMFAIEQRKLHAVHLLLAEGAGANVPIDGQTPLELAAHCSTIAIMQELMKHGARLTPKLCLHAPVRHDVFYFLVGVARTIKRHPKRRPHHRVYGMTRDVIEMCLDNMLLHVQDEKELGALIGLGVNLSFKDAQGKTALDYAVADCRWKVAKILLSKGACAALPGSVAAAQQALSQADTLDRRNACTITTQLPLPNTKTL